ncbi:MAG: FtsX-like permease family protein, partial [Longimicrobiales bacterium]|nr:FtsX-like permease family protein [Longimicrobiales bacterium]
GPGAAATFVLRTRPGVVGLATSIRRAVQTVDPSLEPFRPRFLAERVSASLGPTRFILFLMGSFALVALVVAVVGLFGVIAFGVRTRTAELGIRMAVGAEPRRILSMVLGRAALLTLLGVAGGTGAALVLGRFLQAVTFGISPTEPLTLGAMALTLAVVSVLACLAPARWACRVDPVRALRGVSH